MNQGQPFHGEVDVLGLIFRPCQAGAEEQDASGTVFLGNGTNEG